MDQDQSAMHGRELDDLTKRNQQLYDQWTRTDIECSRAVEDLQIATGRIEQLRNECANLRAEKKIWEVRTTYFRYESFVMISNRACKVVLSRRTKPWAWSVRIFLTLWLMFRKCTMTLSVLEKMIAVDLRVSYKCWKVKRKENPHIFFSEINCFYRQDLRIQVSQERDNIRHISLQKDIELKELQTRLDKNVMIRLLKILLSF